MRRRLNDLLRRQRVGLRRGIQLLLLRSLYDLRRRLNDLLRRQRVRLRSRLQLLRGRLQLLGGILQLLDQTRGRLHVLLRLYVRNRRGSVHKVRCREIRITTVGIQLVQSCRIGTDDHLLLLHVSGTDDLLNMSRTYNDLLRLYKVPVHDDLLRLHEAAVIDDHLLPVEQTAVVAYDELLSVAVVDDDLLSTDVLPTEKTV